MTLATVLRTLEAAGITLSRDGADLMVDVPTGMNLDPHRSAIAEHKSALLARLALQDEIVAAATVATAAFDRQHYDELWRRWRAVQHEGMTNP